MIADWLILVLIATGHLALFVVSLNLLHSTAVPDKVLDALNLLFLGVFVAGLGAMAWLGPWSGWPPIVRGYGGVCLAVAVVGLPGVTIARAFRRTPPGVSTRRERHDLKAELGADRVVGDGKHHWILSLPGNHSLQFEAVDCEIRSASLPTSLHGLKVVQVSDTHFARCYGREYFEAVADRAASWDADLVVFTGDLLDDVSTIDWVGPVMSRLRGRLGQFAILGNHDHRLRPGRARRALRNAGFVDLDGRWTRISTGPGGPSIALGGTSEPWGPPIDYDAMPAADFRLLLSHSPDQFPRARSRGVDLVLAGHNHGGQVRIPGFGPLLMPSRYSRHFDRGFFGSARSLLYVNQGVGGKHPIRYGCYPEVTRFQLLSTRVATAGPAVAARSHAHQRDLVGDPRA